MVSAKPRSLNRHPQARAMAGGTFVGDGRPAAGGGGLKG